MSFPSARARLTSKRRAALDSLLGEWAAAPGVPPFAAANLHSENGAPTTRTAKYLALLADNRTRLAVTPPGPREAFEELRAEYALQGHNADALRPLILGRAILLVKYARHLAPRLEAFGCFDTEDQIRLTLRALSGLTEAAAPKHLRVYFDAMRVTPLGRGVTFATFAFPARTGRRPWEAPLPDATAVRNTLALGEDPDGDDYLLFAYRIHSPVPLRTPTTASPDWFYQRWFRPSARAATELHGWTSPISPAFPARPELVHAEVDGATLEPPIHVANA